MKKLTKYLIILLFSLILIVTSIVFLYMKSGTFSYWIDRYTIFKNLKIPIPKYEKIEKIDDSNIGYSVYKFFNVNGWDGGLVPIWHTCKIKSGKDERFDYPYKKYIGKETSKLYLVTKDNLSLVYIKDGNDVYLVVLSIGAGPANNVMSKIIYLRDICQKYDK